VVVLETEEPVGLVDQCVHIDKVLSVQADDDVTGGVDAYAEVVALPTQVLQVGLLDNKLGTDGQDELGLRCELAVGLVVVEDEVFHVIVAVGYEEMHSGGVKGLGDNGAFEVEAGVVVVEAHFFQSGLVEGGEVAEAAVAVTGYIAGVEDEVVVLEFGLFDLVEAMLGLQIGLLGTWERLK